MAIINRVTRLFRADFNAVLDQLEEPELILNQAIRDMEDDLAERERYIRQRRIEQRALADRQQALDKLLFETAEQLDLCFANGKEELAKKLIRRKLETERVCQRLAAQSDGNERYLTEQQAAVKDDRLTLEGLRQKAELLAARPPQHGSTLPQDLLSAAHDMVSDDEVEVVFLREKRQRGAS